MSEGPDEYADFAQQARRRYAELLASGKDAHPWWDTMAMTASSKRQAERYEWEIDRRRKRGHIPAGVQFLVIPDPGDRRVGSGGATIHALSQIAPSGAGWWRCHRVLLIHCGGDSRRLPQYSLSGKLFSALPVKTSWGEASTVFDETLALSTDWARETPAGLVIGSGDVVLTFGADRLQWQRPGVCGVALRQPATVGMQHGVYVADEKGRVYSFLQKPSMEALRASGALIDGQEVALDIGLLHFAPDTAARLRDIELPPDSPPIDLYQHVTMALTGQWAPKQSDAGVFLRLAQALENTPFWCSLVEGEFIHVGTTTLLRDLMTSAVPAQQRIGGVAVDCVLMRGAHPAPGSVFIECNLPGAIHAGRGCVLHGLEGIPDAIEAPDDTVLHQVPVALMDGRKGIVIRAYGVADDPKTSAAGWQATWFGRPMLEELRSLGIDLAKVWPGLGPEKWTLWNAQLFPVCPEAAHAWACARWMMRLPGNFSAADWERYDRLSLETSTQYADVAAIEAAHNRRMQANWCGAAVALAESGADIRPMLAHSPGLGALAHAGRLLEAAGRETAANRPTEAASRYFQAAIFFSQAGLEAEAEHNRERSFELVDCAVRMGASQAIGSLRDAAWQRDQVSVGAPVRLDLGGGWSDTPPFCLDWGGTVLNLAVELKGKYPIRAVVRRIDEPVIRCWSDHGSTGEEYRDFSELVRSSRPGDPFLLPRMALRITGVFGEGAPLAEVLERIGGGIEIRTETDVPMGSGLGASSILAATTIWALAEMFGEPLESQTLSDRTMHLEQLMTTGGGWQDQAGGIFPGAKLVSSGPGVRQHLRVQRVAWTPEREREFEDLMVLYYTGIRRIAKDLLRQVVGRYLARETAAVQVLHSIKTLAMEMSFAMQEGDWDYLGRLLDRHWELNQILDPNTANAPINALLGAVRPFLRGAKLAGAGGGGFMMLLARSPEAAQELRAMLIERSRVEGGEVYDWKISQNGPCIEA